MAGIPCMFHADGKGGCEYFIVKYTCGDLNVVNSGRQYTNQAASENMQAPPKLPLATTL